MGDKVFPSWIHRSRLDDMDPDLRAELDRCGHLERTEREILRLEAQERAAVARLRPEKRGVPVRPHPGISAQPDTSTEGLLRALMQNDGCVQAHAADRAAQQSMAAPPNHAERLRRARAREARDLLRKLEGGTKPPTREDYRRGRVEKG